MLSTRVRWQEGSVDLPGQGVPICHSRRFHRCLAASQLVAFPSLSRGRAGDKSECSQMNPGDWSGALQHGSTKQECPEEGDGSVLAAFSHPNWASCFLLLLEVVIQNPATLTEIQSPTEMLKKLKT